MPVLFLQILPPLSNEDLLPDIILKQGKEFHIEKGNYFHTPGKPLTGIYYIKEGLARTFRETDEGERRTLHIIGKGYFLFESYYFSNKPLQISCEAIKPLSVIHFMQTQIMPLMTTESAFSKSLLRSMGLKMQLMGYDLVSTAYEKPHVRIKCCLASLALNMGDNRPNGIALQITQHELAELVGLHRVTVTKILNKLQKDGLLYLGRGNLIISEDFFLEKDIRRWMACS